uniref:Protein yellow n=1 Tax=Megaselia scalaris TaxID=36166 RepID=T1GCN6_MEGSC
VVDSSENNCENTFAYLADAGSYGIVVYSFKENKSWRIEHNFFHMDPFVGAFRVSDVLFTWRDGIFGMALGHLQDDFQTRDIYFHTLIGSKEFSVSNRILQNESYSSSTDPVYEEFKIIGDRGPNGHSTTEVFDPNTNVIYFTQVSKNDSDPIKMVMPVDIKLDDDGFIWLISNRMPQFILKKLNYEDFNYRVLSGKASDLIQDTVCATN